MVSNPIYQFTNPTDLDPLISHPSNPGLKWISEITKLQASTDGKATVDSGDGWGGNGNWGPGRGDGQGGMTW